MKPVKVTITTASLNQNTVPIHLALLDENFVSIHPEVMCKDYLSDLLWAEARNKTATIYGFVYKPGSQKAFFESPTARLSVKYDGIKKCLPGLIPFLHEFEAGLGFPKTEVIMTTEENRVVLVFSNQWLRCIYISMYLYLIRIGMLCTTTAEEHIAKLCDKTIRSKGELLAYTGDNYFYEDWVPNNLRNVLAGKGLAGPLPTFEDMGSAMTAHCNGFIGYKCHEVYTKGQKK